jgi:Neuraminidase (sialidase)
MNSLPFILAMLAIVSGAPATNPSDHAHREVSPGVTSLDVYAEGDRIHLLLARSDARRAVRVEYQCSTDGGATWSQPVRVDRDLPSAEIAHRGQDVQIAAAGSRLVAVWTAKNDADRFGRGALVVAISDDYGKTWKAGGNPADDGNPQLGRAFADIAADRDGAFHLAWLDGRGGDGSKGLFYARSNDGGATWSANRVLDDRTCECCWNAIAVGRDGKLFVLYRDYDPRDMAIVRSDDAGRTWSRPVPVGQFNWTINGCPHVGGALALADDPNDSQIYATVWTAKDDSARGAYVLSSPDAGTTWSEPCLLGDARSWHPDIACGDGVVVAAWDAYVEGGTAVFAATSRDQGRTWSNPIRLSSEGRSATHPHVVRTRGATRVFWTEQDKDAECTWASRLVGTE